MENMNLLNKKVTVKQGKLVVTGKVVAIEGQNADILRVKYGNDIHKIYITSSTIIEVTNKDIKNKIATIKNQINTIVDNTIYEACAVTIEIYDDFEVYELGAKIELIEDGEVMDELRLSFDMFTENELNNYIMLARLISEGNPIYSYRETAGYEKHI